MLAYERTGSGPPLVLLHGTNASREIWRPLLPRLAERRDVIAVDLPGHGDSAPTSMTPPAWAEEVIALLDTLHLQKPAVVGHSSGGWTALELAVRGRAGAALALAPAGLWRRRSPWRTDLGLVVNWGVSRMLGGTLEWLMRSAAVRRVGLRSISARPAGVPAEAAVAMARDVVASRHFPEHFRRTRVLRFTGGAAIGTGVPVTVVWGDGDTVALARRSRFSDELPAHATVLTWARCGHMTMWDRPDDVVRAALAL